MGKTETCEKCGAHLTKHDCGNGGFVWNDEGGHMHVTKRCQEWQIELLRADARDLRAMLVKVMNWKSSRLPPSDEERDAAYRLLTRTEKYET